MDTETDEALTDEVLVAYRGQRRDHVLPLRQRLAYSVGHVLNDLCASMWFSYLLVYMHLVQQFSNTLAGYLLLIGQVADAIATPFVGIESDRNNSGWWLCRYGKRKTWHLFGTVCVFCSFPFLFIKCISCENSHQLAQLVYYAAFIVIFQFGWASVQISHLSLIPDLTPFSNERVELNALRYAFTVASNIIVYVITWLILGFSGDNETGDQIGPKDAIHFRNIVISVVAIGAIFSCIFHVFVKERVIKLPIQQESFDNDPDINTEQDVDSNLIHQPHLKWRHWFSESQFYKVGLLYMGTRLCVNLTQVYTPLYLQDTLHLTRESIAYIPLVMYCTGLISAFIMKYLNAAAGKKLTYFLGSFIALAAYTWLYFGQGDNYRKYEIYGVAALIGISGSTMLITSLAITNDLIGHNTSSGAFVFGAMSFIDKLSNGVAVIIIQHLHPCTTCHCTACDDYYRNVLTFVCGGSTVLALLALALLMPYEIGASLQSLQRNRADIDSDRANNRSEDADSGLSEPLLDDDFNTPNS